MEKLVLVHLSDIHFTKTSGKTAHDLDANVRNELLLDAIKLTKDLSPVTGVLVTGDIAFSGQKDEYKQAAEWLHELCTAIGCPDENVWTVPGNHDVDRKAAGSKITRTLHQSIRSKDSTSVDSELREIFADPLSASALLTPLAEYNAFAARFQCSISAERPFWERDLELACGTIIRLRGLCSALVSNEYDEKGNIVLGTAQASVSRAEGVLYLTLCHHPPDWLRDQDEVVDHLDSKVHIQLFGHKHSQRVKIINEKLRLVAGAMHPERSDREWVPAYNFLELARRDDDRIGLRLFHRRWHQPETRFIAEYDLNSGKEYREVNWSGYPRPTRKNQSPSEALDPTGSKLAISEVAAQTTAKESESMPTLNHERRLTYRFLTLPFRHQFAIAQSLNVLTDEDGALSNEALFREVFKRAATAGLLAKLWDETEKRHTDPSLYNPFEDET